MASLQEQLLKAGLTTKQKARQANTEKRKKNKQKRSGVEQEATLQEKVKQDLQQAKSEKKAKDNALNEEKKLQLAAKEQGLRIQQILQHHQINNVLGDNEYNYTFNNKIKKIAVNDLTYKALVNGRLALCGFDEVTYIVTSETAAKVAELDKSIVLVQNDKVLEEDATDDDPYAEYQIPDDLMW
ncbi:DUF2058 domain-containing protein [Colwellia sp. RSH04]|uniref:DUF2058 domain-containing protein n=1 Tax=Colwellia sp. RSH04 TaxID=2305464 RepID=UPI000E59493F|nr:DUF2058 domain-containing protein [Colwellia sp. RSH04]RHW75363.1 DUF2058 domain-containing protein [Colwellia sp. RSH04]